MELEEDRRVFLQSVRERPLSERVTEGFSWYPLQVLQTGFSLGEKAYVVVERTTRLNEPHQLRAGQSVSLFTQAPHVTHPDKQGIIHFVERNKMKIILNARDVPDWLNLGQLGVELMFDDRSYREMQKALEKLMSATGDRLAELRRLFSPPSLEKGAQRVLPRFTAAVSAPPEVPLEEDAFGNKESREGDANAIQELNLSQQNAIQHMLTALDVSVMHGPPGTGKTTTLVEAIRLMCKQENTVLVTAPSNTAADLLTERLAARGLQVVRIGNISRVDESVVSHTLEALLTTHPESKNLKKVKIQAAEYRRQSRQFKRNFGHEERRERAHLKLQAKELESWAITLENRMIDEIISSAQAITCTLVGAAHPVLEPYRFRTCVIDEAAQALEPACWIPISKCSRVILAGDPFQLPPTVKSLEASRNGLSHTLIERCLELFPEQIQLLNLQYRMHEAIMGFSNAYFYKGALQAAKGVAGRRLFTLGAAGTDITVFEPVVFIDTAGCDFEEKTGEGNQRKPSRSNPDEAVLIREHLLQLLAHFPGGHYPSIGILSPYRGQVDYLNTLLLDDPDLGPILQAEKGNGGVINTIDGFQGQERDVIYISLVRSNAKNEIGFLSDYRRMNVAMTRARMLLVVVGDSATIGKNKFYESFLDYCAANGRYDTAWAYMK